MRRLALAALLALAAAPAAGQVVVGGGRPSVEVDLSAIPGSAAAPSGPVPGYERPLLIPPVEAPKLTPPKPRSTKSAGRKPASKPASKPRLEAKTEPAGAPPLPPLAPAAVAAAAAPPLPSPGAAPPPPAPSAPPSAVAAAPASAPAPAPQAFAAPPGASAPAQVFQAPPPVAPARPEAPARAEPPAKAAAPAKAEAPARETPATAAPSAAPSRPVQMAALPPAGGDLSLEFQGDGAELNRAAQEQLRGLAARLKDNDMRLQLKAYASGGADGASRARRISLSRALAVRSFLIEQGLRSTRIDVRALGLVRDGGPEDRVDIAVLAQ